MLSKLDRSVAEVVAVDDYVRVLYNPASVAKCKYVAFDNGNIIADVSNCVVIDKEKCVDVDGEYVVEVNEANESELTGKRISSIDVAFEVYNECAFCKGFSISCDRLRKREGSQEVHSREFHCSKTRC